ncbi:hypothetical protein SALB1_1549 [Salinisphaera sp. LB1]|nr:hypothetical protein SALB1_1549 [Salinisphaera sp. LB1]
MAQIVSTRGLGAPVAVILQPGPVKPDGARGLSIETPAPNAHGD